MPQLTLGGDSLHDDPLPFACAGCSRADKAWARTRISVANVLLLHHRLHQFLPLARSLSLPQFLPLARSQTTLRWTENDFKVVELLAVDKGQGREAGQGAARRGLDADGYSRAPAGQEDESRQVAARGPGRGQLPGMRLKDKMSDSLKAWLGTARNRRAWNRMGGMTVQTRWKLCLKWA